VRQNLNEWSPVDCCHVPPVNVPTESMPPFSGSFISMDVVFTNPRSPPFPAVSNTFVQNSWNSVRRSHGNSFFFFPHSLILSLTTVSSLPPGPPVDSVPGAHVVITAVSEKGFCFSRFSSFLICRSPSAPATISLHRPPCRLASGYSAHSTPPNPPSA